MSSDKSKNKQENAKDDIEEDVIETPNFSGKNIEHKGYNAKNIALVAIVLLLAGVASVKVTSCSKNEKTPEELALEKSKNVLIANAEDSNNIGVGKLQSNYSNKEDNKLELEAQKIKESQNAITTNEQIINQKNNGNNQTQTQGVINPQNGLPYPMPVAQNGNGMPAVPQYQNGNYSVPSPQLSPAEYQAMVERDRLEKIKQENEMQKIKAENERRRVINEINERARRGGLSFNAIKEALSGSAKSNNGSNINIPTPKMPDFKMPSVGSLMPEADSNKQKDKQSYLDKNREGSTNRVLDTMNMPRSPYQIMAGTIIPSTFITGINGDLPGQIIGQVRENIYDSVSGHYLLIPQGTRLVGEYSNTITSGQDRILMVWTRLILPNGKSINLEGMPGVDLSGYAGVTDKVNYHFMKIAAGAILSSMMGAGVTIASGNNAAGSATFPQLAASGAAQKAQSAGDAIINQMLKIQPTIEIRPGNKYNVFVNKDIVLQPYR